VPKNKSDLEAQVTNLNTTIEQRDGEIQDLKARLQEAVTSRNEAFQNFMDTATQLGEAEIENETLYQKATLLESTQTFLEAAHKIMGFHIGLFRTIAAYGGKDIQVPLQLAQTAIDEVERSGKISFNLAPEAKEVLDGLRR
jgi:chromosome segregation ATPase